MTEKECLAAGIAVSLFAHFALLIAPRPPEPEPSFTTVVQMDHHRNGTHPRHSARQIPIRPPLIAPPPGNPAGSHGEGRVGLAV